MGCLKLNYYQKPKLTLFKGGKYAQLKTKVDKLKKPSRLKSETGVEVIIAGLNHLSHVNDIRFRDKNGKLIGTYETDAVDDDVYLPTEYKGEGNINLNNKLDAFGLSDIDIIGVGAEAEFTFGMGGG